MESRDTRIKKQVVAGFIIFRRTHEGIKFLLLYRRGNYWNFPKGHFEIGETSFRAALRETEEETGLRHFDLHIVPGFKTYLHFSFERGHQKIHDKMILFLAETRNPRVTISPREHSGFAWFLYPDAVRTIGSKYVSTKRALKQAYGFIIRRRGLPHRQKNP